MDATGRFSSDDTGRGVALFHSDLAPSMLG